MHQSRPPCFFPFFLPCFLTGILNPSSFLVPPPLRVLSIMKRSASSHWSTVENVWGNTVLSQNRYSTPHKLAHTHTVGLRTVKIGTKTAPVCTKSLRLNLFLLLRFKLHLGLWISRITTPLKDAPTIMKIYSNYTKHTTTA